MLRLIGACCFAFSSLSELSLRGTRVRVVDGRAFFACEQLAQLQLPRTIEGIELRGSMLPAHGTTAGHSICAGSEGVTECECGGIRAPCAGSVLWGHAVAGGSAMLKRATMRAAESMHSACMGNSVREARMECYGLRMEPVIWQCESTRMWRCARATIGPRLNLLILAVNWLMHHELRIAPQGRNARACILSLGPPCMNEANLPAAQPCPYIPPRSVSCCEASHPIWAGAKAKAKVHAGKLTERDCHRPACGQGCAQRRLGAAKGGNLPAKADLGRAMGGDQR
jgi:hypothetical protein